MSKIIQIGTHSVGIGRRPLFLPDIGTFFNQDMSLAKEMVDKLSISGVSVIKGEILHSADICLKENSGKESYWGHCSGAMQSEDYRSLIERKIISLSAYEDLFRYSQNLGMEVVVSVYDFVGADFAKDIGAVALKIASSNITHQPLISHISKLGLPIILDTGHSDLKEVARAISWSKNVAESELIVEHSPLGPPNSVEQHSLNFMNTLGAAFDIPYGLSDHHIDDEMLYAATAMGAIILEKGVCPDDMGDEQDGGHALPISRVKDVLLKINNVYSALGKSTRDLRYDRIKYSSRMGLVAKHNLKAGDKINFDNVTFAFPNKGIGTEYWGDVFGWKLSENISKGQPINWHQTHASTT
ncbi:N-acetylneuraminate synthase family protein [Amylibacter sp.]|nr:N-acetylneuraminate synthase family protein [Amylibacter sp.]